MPEDAEPQPLVPVPHEDLSPEALQGVIETFVLREGTDYGERDYSLVQKSAHVLRQLERGEARIVYDPNTLSVDIRVVNPKERGAATDPSVG